MFDLSLSLYLCLMVDDSVKQWILSSQIVSVTIGYLKKVVSVL